MSPLWRHGARNPSRFVRESLSLPGCEAKAAPCRRSPKSAVARSGHLQNGLQQPPNRGAPSTLRNRLVTNQTNRRKKSKRRIGVRDVRSEERRVGKECRARRSGARERG